MCVDACLHNLHAMTTNCCKAHLCAQDICHQALATVFEHLGLHRSVPVFDRASREWRRALTRRIRLTESLYTVQPQISIALLTDYSGLRSLSLRNLWIRCGGLNSLCNLPNLRTLDVSRNDLSRWGVCAIGQLTRLTGLSLRDCSLQNKVKYMTALTALRDLDLSLNFIGIGTDMLHLATLTNLQRLDLSRNGLGDFRYNLSHLAALTNLTELSLAVNLFPVESIRALSTLTALHRLDVSCCHVNETWAGAIAEALTSLRFLRAAHNFLGGDGVRALATLPCLVDLDINHDLDGNPVIGTPDALSTLTGLTRLNVYECGLDRDACTRTLGLLVELRDLDCGVETRPPQHRQVRTPVENLTRLTNLTRLSLHAAGPSNGLGPIAALTGLQDLCLFSCGLDPGDTVHLTGLTRLTALDLRCNMLGVEDVPLLRGLTGSLQVLRLGGSFQHNVDLSGLQHLDPGDPIQHIVGTSFVAL